MYVKQRNTLMKAAEAREITGGLSKPSKMPGMAYSIPAVRCKIGAKLAKKKGSVCHGCYALKGFYRMPVVKAALERRYQSLSNDRWVDAMVVLVSKHTWFRWHDSGDLQSVTHLRKICDVCTATPNTRHWLPTREVAIVHSYLSDGTRFPDNLCVRVSSPMVGGVPLPYPNTSTVVRSDGEEAVLLRDGKRTDHGDHGTVCPASTQDNKCMDCRSCWNKEVKNVAYINH